MRHASFLLPLHAVSARELWERMAQLVLGLIGYGFGLALMLHAGIGLAPWDVFAIGFVRHLPIGYGTATVAISVLVLVLWIPLRQRMGVGTLANTLLVGPSADLGLLLLPQAENWVAGAALFAAGLVVVALSTGVYISADLGPGPRDGLMTGLIRVTGWPIWIVRTLLEGSVLLVGWLLGGPVGVGTVAFAFGVGPLIGLCLPRFERWRQARSARMRVALRTPSEALTG